MPYELFYWPSIQGRGEFVRLALEEAGADYVDVARTEKRGGMRAMQKLLAGDGIDGPPPFAPPFLRDGKLVIAHVANILAYLGPRIGLVGKSDAARHRASMLELTITDLVAETHDTHHPVASSLYYEDQKREAVRAAKDFVSMRIPKFLGYFERVLEKSGGRGCMGRSVSYVDLSLFQVVEGLRLCVSEGHARDQSPP